MKGQRAKFWMWVAIVLGVAAGVLALVYSYFAFAPTGYGKIEKRYAEAVKRIDASLSSLTVAA